MFLRPSSSPDEPQSSATSGSAPAAASASPEQDPSLDPEVLAALEGTGEEPAGPGQGAPPGEGEEESFFDPAQVVTEDDRNVHARMQAAFTQKTQKVAEKSRVVDAKETSLTQREAQLQQQTTQLQSLQRLMPYLQDPRTQQFLEATFGEGPGGQPAAGGTGGEELELDPQVAQAVRQQMKPVESRIQRLQEQVTDQVVLAEFVRTHPDWEKHMAGMKEAWTQDQSQGLPARSRDAAYDYAFRVKVQRAIEARRAQAARSQAGVEGTGVTSSNAPAPREIKGFDDAMRAALEEAGHDPRRVLGAQELT